MLTFYRVTTTEYRGYECDGHEVKYVVAANSPEEAVQFISDDIKLDEWDEKPSVEPFTLPTISPRRRKPFSI